MLKLYSYFRSSASYRVRIALNWKQLPYEYVPVHLIKDGGQQNQAAYRRINPMGHVPALEHDGFLLAESVAIMQYLDSLQPERPLFPSDPRAHAKVLQICEVINSGIQPLQNIKVTKSLESDFGLGKPDVERWLKHWVEDGLQNLERLLETTAGTYCFGDEVTAADTFVIPQCFSSRRFGIRVENFPILSRIEANATKLEPFRKAHPQQQPDFA